MTVISRRTRRRAGINARSLHGGHGRSISVYFAPSTSKARVLPSGFSHGYSTCFCSPFHEVSSTLLRNAPLDAAPLFDARILIFFLHLPPTSPNNSSFSTDSFRPGEKNTSPAAVYVFGTRFRFIIVTSETRM